MTGTVFNIQRYSIHDGPGIRTTVFLKGCPLSCTWCHNPEGVEREPELVVLGERCVDCGACIEVCPNPPVSDERGRRTTDRLSCLRCGACVEVCAPGARKLVGSSMSVESLLDALERDRAFYDQSGGGVTFSGGEPFAQWEYLLECLEQCRERGIRTAVDTSGFVERELLLRAAALTDLFLYDLKLMDDARHRELTGVPLAPVLANLRTLDDAGAAIWIRFPLIPGVTDDMENVKSLGRTVASLRTNRVHVLPFHRTATDKYARLGRPWEHAGIGEQDERKLADVVRALREMGLDARAGG